jgi:hypothetical protein
VDTVRGHIFNNIRATTNTCLHNLDIPAEGKRVRRCSKNISLLQTACPPPSRRCAPNFPTYVDCPAATHTHTHTHATFPS